MLAFAHIQKTAGTTLVWVLRHSFGIRHLEVEPWRPFAGRKRYFDTTYSAEDHRHVERIVPWLQSIAGHHVKPHSDLDLARPDVRYFLFVREPVARSVSHFQGWGHSMGYRKSFEEWLSEERLHDLQTRHIAGRPDVDEAMRILRERCIMVGLQERFDESLVLLKERTREWYPQLDIRYRSANVAPNRDVERDLLGDPHTRSLLESANQVDAQLYERIRDELYAEQVREFGAGLERAVEAFRAHRDVRTRTLKAYASPALRRLVVDRLADRSRRRIERLRSGETSG